MRILRGHSGQIRALAYSPDGSILATGGDDGAIRLWDPMTGRERPILPPQGRRWFGVKKLTFSPNGDRLAAVTNTVAVWGVASRSVIFRQPATPNHSVVFTPHGSQLIVSFWFAGPAPSTLLSYEVTTGTQSTPFGIYRDSAEAVACSVRRHLLAVGFHEYSLGRDRNFIRLWDLDDRGQRPILENGPGRLNRCQALAFSPDGGLLAVAGGHDVWIWEVANSSRRGRLSGHTKQVNSVCFSPDGNVLLTGGSDGTVRLWDVATLRQRTVFDWETDRVHGVAFAPDGMTAAVVGKRPKVVIWDVDT